jgi:hypothetical protein
MRYVSPELEIEVASHDLSESGVFVRSQVLDPIGTPCQLTFLLGGGQLGAHGIVRRVVEHGPPGANTVGLGVEFVGLGSSERAWLQDVIAHPDAHLPRAAL